MRRLFAVISSCLAATAAVAGAWYYLGQPVAMPPSPLASGEKLSCVSYAPFRRGQTPFNETFSVPESQIREDFKHLKEFTDCVRTYAVNQGLEHVPKIAQEMDMQVIMGLWLGRDAQANALQISEGIKLARQYPQTIRLVVVGNEVLLRGELSGEDLGAIMRDVKTQISIPVTYADVWEYWLKHPDLKDVADVITIHILPYWEDQPIPAENAAAHIANIRNEMALKVSNKPILIGETGFPSQGRMRWEARPSPAAQALVFHDLVRISKQYNFDVNYIEAFDQPWKRSLEGVAGGFWGIFDADTREAKFHWGEAVSNHPQWFLNAILGIGLAVAVFGSALLAARTQTSSNALRWAGVGMIAAVSGIALGFALDLAFLASRTPAECVLAGLYLLCATLTPLLGAALLIRSQDAAPFAAIMRAEKASSKLSWWFGALCALTTILALQAVFGLVFDSRYRNFPTSCFIGAVVAFIMVRFGACHRKEETAASFMPRQRFSEHLTAFILGLGGLAIMFIESPLNAPASVVPSASHLPNLFANWEAGIFVLTLFGLALALYKVRKQGIAR